MVARNRFLAESMLNGNHKVNSNGCHKKYSVPTCHSTLKQMEQARLAKEFAEQRKELSRTSSVGKLVNNFENGSINNNNEEFGLFSPLKPKPPLAAKPMLRHTVSLGGGLKRLNPINQCRFLSHFRSIPAGRRVHWDETIISFKI